MAEAAGLAIGVVALAGLFDNTVRVLRIRPARPQLWEELPDESAC